MRVMCSNSRAARAVISLRQWRALTVLLPPQFPLALCPHALSRSSSCLAHRVSPPPPPHALSRSSSCLAYRVPFPTRTQLRAGHVARLARSVLRSCSNLPTPPLFPARGYPGRCSRTHLTMPYAAFFPLRPARRAAPPPVLRAPRSNRRPRCSAHCYSTGVSPACRNHPARVHTLTCPA